MSRQQLQQTLFAPNDERLITMISVAKMPRKTNLKKRSSLLCAVLNTMESPAKVYIYHLKKTDRVDGYKKKMSWLLRDLKTLDGKSAEKPTTEFDLHFFEKTFKWSASTLEEKESFISSLWRLSHRFLMQRPEFINVLEKLLEDIKDPHTMREKSQSVDDISMEAEDYQAISPKEESDLELLMSECQMAISNAELFTEQLSKQLSVLDGANIHSIMGSEDQVLNLMRLLDDGIKEAEQIEEKLDSYDKILANVKEQMEVMREKDSLMTVRNRNHQRLLEELQNLVNQLDLDLTHMQVLMDGDFSNATKIAECTIAAQALHRCMNANIHPSLLRMGAVEEQQKRFKKISANFSKTLIHHLNNLFIQEVDYLLFGPPEPPEEEGESDPVVGNEIGTLSRTTPENKLPHHNRLHTTLVQFADLMLWLKSCNESVFQELSNVYTKSISKVYSKEISEFLEQNKQKLVNAKETKTKHAALSRLTESTTSLTKLDPRGRSGSVTSSELKTSSALDLTNRGAFDQVLEQVLQELEKLCIVEQDFCFKFFHLIDKNAPPEEGNAKDKDVSTGGGDGDTDVWVVRQNNSSSDGDFVTENLGGGLLQKRPTVTSEMRQINDEVRKMMAELFPQLETDLDNFLTHADRQDGLYSMYMLVRMSQHVTNSQDMGSYIGKTFGNCLIKVKRNFDRYIDSMMQTIKETKVSKKSKCGIISFVNHFERNVLPYLYELFQQICGKEIEDNCHSLHHKYIKSFGNFCPLWLKPKRYKNSLVPYSARLYQCNLVTREGENIKMPEFSTLAEIIFRGSERHADLDKAYTKVVAVIFDQIERVALEHQKTPPEVVRMAILSHLKNPCLENDRKEAKQRYTDNLKAYTVNLLGRPLEKLHVFFEGVEARLSKGMKPEEIGYVVDFSKQELRKIIKEYPGKEVKKNLEHLKKKVEKKLCEEENLIQVVWHEMQDLFINQYKYYDSLMKKCYPDSNITLEFTIENVLQFFSDIAQSH